MPEQEVPEERWDPVVRNPIVGWTAGDIVIGTLVAVRDGRFGQLMDLRSEEGKLHTYGVPVILGQLLAEIKPGEIIRIRCEGKVKTSSGNEAWLFGVDRRAQDALPF